MADKPARNAPAAQAGAIVQTGTTVLRVPESWLTSYDDAAVVTTYPLETVEGRRGCFKALNADCQGAEDWINKVLLVQHVVMHPVQMTDEKSGETSVEVRTICVDADGNCVSFVSKGVCRFFARLTQFGLPGPWNPPLRLLLRRKQLDGGRSTYTLQEQE